MGPIAEHRAVCFIRFPTKTGFTRAYFCGGKLRESETHTYSVAVYNYNRPVKTDILGENYPFRRPQTATSRFIAHQAGLLYHIFHNYAIHFLKKLCVEFEPFSSEIFVHNV